MEIPAETIKSLREQTAAGLMDCKRALSEAKGDVSIAIDILRKRGFALAEKKSGRATQQGLIEAYVHGGGRIGTLVEVNCESDFVARTPEFKELAHDIAMQVAATNPTYISPEDAPPGQTASSDNCLLLQCFIKAPDKTIQNVISETVAKVRENIKIRRIARFELGVES